MSSWCPKLESADSEVVIALATAGDDAIWFGGHFPAEPVLPGVAMLALVEETFRTFVQKASSPAVIVAMRRVRFKHMVRPHAVLRLKLTRCRERHYAFELDSDGTPACSGTFEVGEESA
jgi:3-hydroxymyristoyl/3-hydroxydecanoyl-(acyl carrier protein) dehydratase